MARSDAVVLDASAVIALTQREPGAEIVEAAVSSAMMNAVNAAECVLVLGRTRSTAWAASAVASLGIEIVPCDWAIAVAAADIHAATRARGLSLGDCICLATARNANMPVLTADHAWHGLDVGVTIEILR